MSRWQLSLRRLRGCRGEALLLGIVLVYAGVMWVWGVGRLDIAHSMEAARAVGARTMMRTGDSLIPRIEARYNLAKPPLFYWAVAATLPMVFAAATVGEVTLPP